MWQKFKCFINRHDWLYDNSINKVCESCGENRKLNSREIRWLNKQWEYDFIWGTGSYKDDYPNLKEWEPPCS